MRTTVRIVLRACLLPAMIAALSPASRAIASHTIFSASCDRFEADGNAFGSPGGALDFVDDFGGGTLAPNWLPFYGTATETGGNLVLESPGQDFPIGPTVFDLSNAEAAQDVDNGSGDFTLTSYWAPALPAVDREFHIELYQDASSPIEVAGLTVRNLSPAIAAQEGGGALAGYSISQQVLQISLGMPDVLAFDTVAIAPGDVTGSIVLRLAFDDATDMLTCSFSLDGGATFQSPFSPMHVFVAASSYGVLLGAGTLTAPAGPPPPPQPTAVGTKKFLLQDATDPSGRRLLYSVKQQNYPPNGTTLGDPRVAGATLAVRLDGTAQCFRMPAQGWRDLGGKGWGYTDRTGINGPVTKAAMELVGLASFDLSKRFLKGKATIRGTHGPITLAPGNPSVEADTRFRFVDGSSTDFCSSTAGGVVQKNDARSFKVKDAPAPADCAIPVCSPSGAFVGVLDALR